MAFTVRTTQTCHIFFLRAHKNVPNIVNLALPLSAAKSLSIEVFGKIFLKSLKNGGHCKQAERMFCDLHFPVQKQIYCFWHQ